MTSTAFEITRPATIESDNVGHKVSICQLDFQPEFEYFSTPKAVAHAFLKVKAKNESPYAFLAGPANVFLDNNFVTKVCHGIFNVRCCACAFCASIYIVKGFPRSFRTFLRRFSSSTDVELLLLLLLYRKQPSWASVKPAMRCSLYAWLSAAVSPSCVIGIR